MRSTALLAVAAAAPWAACSRNLELPETGAPTVSSFSPSPAYAGQILTVQGNGFDPAPERNRVQFASGAAATGMELQGSALLVRVPRAAGTGPLSVSNGRGSSAPVGSFTYLGGGELAAGQVARTKVLLHVPTGIASTASDVFVQSQLWGGLVSMLDKSFDGAGASQAISVSSGTALVWLDQAAHQIIRQPVPSGLPGSAPYGGQSFVRLCKVAAAGARPELVAEVAWNSLPRPGCPACGAIDLTTFDAATLAVFDSTRTLALDDFWAVQDGGAGRIALLGVRCPPSPAACPDDGGIITGGAGGLLLVRPGVGDTWVPEPAATPLARRARQPMAAGRLTSGHYLAAFLDVHRNVVTADLDPTSGILAFDPGSIDLHALNEAAAGFAASGKWLVASKRTENLVLGVDLDSRSIAWSTSTTSPGPATGDGALFKVASLASNDALEIAAATGVVLARRDLGLFPGSGLVHGGLAWCPTAVCGAGYELQVHTEYPVGTLVTTPAANQVAGSGTPDGEAVGVAVGGSVQWTWGATWVAAAGQKVTMPGAVLHVAPDAGGAFVVHGQGLSRVEQGALVGTSSFPVDFSSPLDTVATTPPRPAPLPGGGLALAWHSGSSWQVATWSRADVVAGATPRATGLVDPATATFVTDDVLWVATSGTSGSRAISLAGSPPQATGSVALDGPIADLVATSPNGRMLLSVSPGSSEVLAYRSDPDLGFPLLFDIAVAGVVTGVTFDETGDAAYVVTRLPEELVSLE